MPRRPDLPCSVCGNLMWRGRSSRPAGEAVCQPCRRNQHGTVTSYSKRKCRCGPCREANRKASREYQAAVKIRDGISPTQKYRPRGEAPTCAACGEPLRIALPGAVWHSECRPTKFYAKPERRARIYERDEWICQLCGDPVDPTLPHRDPMSATLDHILPRSLGGGNEDDNLRLAHLRCNSRRGNRVVSRVGVA